MFAIKTTYLGPTDTKGTRIVASCYGYKRKTYARDYALGIGQQEQQIAIDYAESVLELPDAKELKLVRAGMVGPDACIYTFSV